MPSSVVPIEENTFRGCHVLNSITVPGCTEFGYKAFGDCCSLQWIHANGGGVNQIGSATKLECLNLATFTILEDGHNPDLLNEEQYRELPTGCFCSTGLKELELPRDFHVLGAHACDSCKLLR